MTRYLLTIFIVLSFFIACEDDGGTVNPVTSPNIGEISLSWLGDYTSHPYDCDAEAEYDAYYNTTEGKTYFCDGIDWRMLAQDGTDGTDGTNGTDGADGVDGKTIQIVDANDVLLGYNLSDYLLMSPNGYPYYLDTAGGTVSHSRGTLLFFSNSDCTGQGFVASTTYDANRGILVYNTKSNIFYKRRDFTIHTTTPHSYVDGSSCLAWSTSYTYYKYDYITHADAGIPETITLPLTYEFK